MKERDWVLNQARVEAARRKVATGELERAPRALDVAVRHLIRDALMSPRDDLRPRKPPA